jgi:TPP-dependent indolepyruvate ferredoxin oxidoreductase alpha subunit
MSFRPEALRGAPTGGLPMAGEVTYRLARNAVVSEFRKGRLSRLDVCDAHPELLRAAQGVGEPTPELCPICEEANVVLVSYAFGSGLPASGRLISSKADLSRAGRTSSGDIACYVVEVCPGCSWNHLAHTMVVSRRRRARV